MAGLVGCSLVDQPTALTAAAGDDIESSQPVAKKRKRSLDECDVDKKLEDRLSGILRCTVCLDLPLTCFQCMNGHLMCAGCFNHLLADARLKNESATCPNCRCEITKTACTRNLAVEKAIAELPCTCKHCNAIFARYALSQHELLDCEERPSSCKYNLIGCKWVGPEKMLEPHENDCVQPTLTGTDIMSALQEKRIAEERQKTVFHQVFDLLSYEKISFNDIQLRPYTTDDYITQLYYESSRFSAFNLNWVIRARVVPESQPQQSCERSLEFQLCLKSKSSNPVKVYYIPLAGPFSCVSMKPVIYDFEFSNENTQTNHKVLPISDSVECNKILAAKTINIRLILFQI